MDKKEIEKMLMTDIDNSREKAFEIAQFIFDHPEISRQEYESSEYLAHYLETEGFAVEMPYCGIPTAFKATRKNGSGPRIAFMAEYDALPGMATAADTVILEAEQIVEIGDIEPDEVQLPGVFVDYVVEAEEDIL